MHHADLMHLLAGVGDRALRTMTLVACRRGHRQLGTELVAHRARRRRRG